ncbi:MltA domain-containing protein [Leptospira bandrabouensis]|uniref:peptidoglycan lytic exotransglycosylase n=1 Tax=Leptospira bandrabouensis TaxID=2484903 RepID=A0A6H3NUI8_9LEPT|nr:MltA domain-containing protein [Leptospira bandrabouensis]TGN04937.1 murein transglycosylase [Leptospira bandrabouensis]TGN15266.1 murein transglycosylase [Leptospira bandrabouensis]
MAGEPAVTSKMYLRTCHWIKISLLVFVLYWLSAATEELNSEPTNIEKRSGIFTDSKKKQTSVSFASNHFSQDIRLDSALNESILYFKRTPKDSKFRFAQTEYSKEEVLQSLEELQQLIHDNTNEEIQNKIQKHFHLMELSPAEGPPTITGYYEVRIYGKTKREGEFQYPALSPPTSDSLSVENPKFFPRERWKEKSTWEKYSKPIIFIRLTDLHLAQLEGSALVQTETNERFRINYAADNGKDYISPSVFLKGICPSLKPYHLSDCIQKKPKEVSDAIFKNPRYIFFERESLSSSKSKSAESVFGPFGSQGIRLVSFRSVAMDKEVPLGFPVLLSFQSKDWSLNHHLVFVHDRGNAISGVGRLDYYLGNENGVEEVANNLLTKGKVILLLPKKKNEKQLDKENKSNEKF